MPDLLVKDPNVWWLNTGRALADAKRVTRFYPMELNGAGVQSAVLDNVGEVVTASIYYPPNAKTLKSLQMICDDNSSSDEPVTVQIFLDSGYGALHGNIIPVTIPVMLPTGQVNVSVVDLVPAYLASLTLGLELQNPFNDTPPSLGGLPFLGGVVNVVVTAALGILGISLKTLEMEWIPE